MRVRVVLALLVLGACSRTGLTLQPEPDAGPGACALVDNACVHTGDASTRCLALGYTAVDPAGPCVDGDVVRDCVLVSAGLACPPAEVCVVVAREDGGPEEALVPTLCGNLPSHMDCGADALRALAAARSANHGLLPACSADAGPPPAPLDAGPSRVDAGAPRVDAGPGTCAIVDNACVHSGGLPNTCCADRGVAIDPSGSCVRNPDKVYRCRLSQDGCLVSTAGACYQLDDADGGVTEYVQAASSWGSGPVAASVLPPRWGSCIPGQDPMFSGLFDVEHLPACGADAGPSRCELVDGGCVKRGDPSRYCRPQVAQFIDAQRFCRPPGNGVYACTDQGGGSDLTMACYETHDADGRPAEIIEVDDGNLVLPGWSSCGADVAGYEDHSPYPSCADLPGRCDLVGGACVHSGDPSTTCAPQNGLVVDAARFCVLPGRTYACAIAQPGGCGGEVRCYVVRGDDGGVAQYVEADSCNQVAPGAEACDDNTWASVDAAPVCAP